ncbi:helix-turn-helix domain-containing protein [Microbulbifer rhizosphaerae]|uniref:Lambda repressor-like predicted transcriptional regulator n=1 Tax=Microbulbifer rhizosphaerae TaxID=1562603 RepID=A0A7W4WCV0_9GAMM|nr:helix-turn-helix domain-containing protein [Microbulbifer rhizosphaerae]MBB3061908.1 lambda repressor-like predicted transcriptional regulator [Microbulbifer rhizosphaerae]
MTDEQRTEGSIPDSRIEQLPSRIKLAMNGASIRAFAEKAGIAEGTLRNLISGGIPRLDNVLRIADAAEVSAAWLATGEGQMRPWEESASGGSLYGISTFQEVIDRVEERLKQEETIPVPPARVLREPELLQAKQQLVSVPQNDGVRSHADWLLIHVFGEIPPTRQGELRKLSMPARLRRADEALTEMEKEMNYKPPAIWREVLKSLIFSHGLDEAGAALLLDRLRLEFEARK